MNSVTIGVPNVDETRAFYRDFNLTETDPGTFASADGGEQLRVDYAPVRRALEVNIGADDPDDVARVVSQLARLGVDAADISDTSVAARDGGTGVLVRVAVAPHIVQAPVAATEYN